MEFFLDVKNKKKDSAILRDSRIAFFNSDYYGNVFFVFILLIFLCFIIYSTPLYTYRYYIKHFDVIIITLLLLFYKNIFVL